MPPLVQVKCVRCLCSDHFEQDSPILAFIDANGCGMPRKGIKSYCPCECHHLNAMVRTDYPKLVSRANDFGDDAPF
jgi:hypothetical protein